jgi:hypothetical protein
METFDAFGVGGREAGDQEIRALFRDWCAAWRAADQPISDDAREMAVTVASAILEKLADLPATSVTGLAIKAFLAARGDDDLEPSRDCCTLGRFSRHAYSVRHGSEHLGAQMYVEARVLRGLLADVGALVPELQPFIERAAASPATLSNDEEEGAVAVGNVVALPARRRGSATDKKPELRRRAKAIVADFGCLPEPTDAGIIEAERCLAALLRARNKLHDDFGDWDVATEAEIIEPTITAAEIALSDFIEDTPADGLAAAAVKLREVLVGMPNQEAMLRQVLAVVERDAGHAARRGA